MFFFITIKKSKSRKKEAMPIMMTMILEYT